MKSYVWPNIEKVKELSDLHSQYNLQQKYIDDYSKIIDSNALLVGKPGYGKSRLLQELKKIMKQQVKKVDLKDLQNLNYEQLKTIVCNDSTLNIETLLLDAFDEVESIMSKKMLNMINSLLDEFENLKVIITCRISSVERLKEFIDQREFAYYKLHKFTKRQLEEMLLANINCKETVRQILGLSTEIYLIPRYATYLLDLIEDVDNTDNTMNSRNLLFSKMVLMLLRKDESELDLYLMRKVYSKIALAMEISQTNMISKDEYLRFFENIDSAVCLRFFLNYNTQNFQSSNLLRYSEGMFQFESSEIQEYLAATEINDLPDKYNLINNVIFNNEIGVFYSSWTSTISFLIEYDSKWYFSLIERMMSGWSNYNSDLVDLIFYVDVESLDDEIELNVFFNEFLTYMNYNKYFLPYEFCKTIVRLIDIEIFDCINLQVMKSKAIDTYSHANNLELIYEYTRKGGKKYSKKISEYCFSLIKNKRESIIQRRSIAILGFLNEKRFIRQLLPYYNLSDELVDRILIETCGSIMPNLKFSLGIYQRSLGNRFLNSWTVIDSIMKITKIEQLNRLLNLCVDDQDFLSLFLHSFDSENRSISISIEKTKKIIKISESLHNFLIVFLDNPEYYFSYNNNRFVISMFELFWCIKRDKFWVILMEKVKNQRNQFNLYDSLIINIMNKSNYKSLMNWIDGMNEKNMLERIGHMLFYSKHPERSELINYLIHDYEYRKPENKQRVNNFEQPLQCDMILKQFETDPLKALNQFQSLTKNQITKISNTNITKITNSFVTLYLGIDENTLYIKRKKASTYTFNSNNLLIDGLIKALNKLNYRFENRKRLMRIFLTVDSLSAEIIQKYLSKLKNSEKRYFVEVNASRDDDAKVFHFYRYIGFLKVMKINSKFVLKEMQTLISGDLEYHYWREVIGIIKNSDVSKTYLKKLQDEIEDVSKLEMLNELLITNFNDTNAILARFEQIKNRSFESEKMGGVRSISSQESELFDSIFFKPLLSIGSKYESKYIELLEYSFILYEGSEKYYDYCNYIWQNVKVYYGNLLLVDREHKLDLLYSCIENNKPFKAIPLFKYVILQLKVHYASSIPRLDIDTSVNLINNYNNKLPVVLSNKELINMTIKILNVDLRNWIEFEGAYRFLDKYINKQEDLIQRTIKAKLEASFYKYGLDIIVDRENELLNHCRPDFVITYGINLRIVLEIKLLKNATLNNATSIRDYYSKLLQYRKGIGASKLILMIIKVDSKKNLFETVNLVESVYKNDSDIHIVSYDAKLSKEDVDI